MSKHPAGRLRVSRSTLGCIYIFVVSAMLAGNASAWLWTLPAKVDGVFYLDHFGGCYCYNDIGFMCVSEKAKSFASPYVNKPVVLNVTGGYQQSVPGDTRLEKFTIDDLAGDEIGRQNPVRLSASWLSRNGASLRLNVCNVGMRSVSIYPGIIDFFVLTSKDHETANQKLLELSNGPSTVLGREPISGKPQQPWHGSYSKDQQALRKR